MAAPITHILFAFQLSKRCSQDFVLGTSFPDIRYLGVIERDITHAYTLDNLLSIESFSAGMAFHQYIDQQREKYWKEHNIHAKLPESTRISQAFKFLEDIVLYDHLQNWKIIGAWFDHIPVEAKTFGISDHDLKRWHRLLSTYIVDGPSLQSIHNFIGALDTSEKLTSEIQELLPTLCKNKDLVKSIEQFYIDVSNNLQNISISTPESLLDSASFRVSNPI